MMKELRALWQLPEQMSRSFGVLHSNVDALASYVRELTRSQESRPLEFQIVIWGKSIPHDLEVDAQGLDPVGKPVVVSESCFSLSGTAIAGTSQRLSFQPQRLFKMTRWLLLGPEQLRVRDVLVGHNVQAPVFTALAGISGRAGEGKFDTADVGNLVTFEVS